VSHTPGLCRCIGLLSRAYANCILGAQSCMGFVVGCLGVFCQQLVKVLQQFGSAFGMSLLLASSHPRGPRASWCLVHSQQATAAAIAAAAAAVLHGRPGVCQG
jgi:hypothetical protein